MDNAIVLASISMFGTLAVGSFAMWQQFHKDNSAQKVELTRIDAENNLELIRIKKEIETDLWDKMRVEFTAMRDLIRTQDETIKNNSATIQEQGALILQLRDRIQRQDDRIKVLEAENAMLKAENEQLKGKRSGGNRV